MANAKVVFFGLGGAGQRHLRILYSLKNKLKLNFFTFTRINKVQAIKKNFNLDKKKLSEKYKDLIFLKKKNSAYLKKNIAIISNHTSGHYNTAIKCAKAGMDIFVEKPFFCDKKKFTNFAEIIKKKKLKFLVGYQRRFSETINKFHNIVKKIDVKKIKQINVLVNSYLPDWHKYENYRNMYASKKSLGGGSLLTECHELDIIIMIFGLPNKLRCKKFHEIKNIDVESRHKITFYYSKFSVYFKINMFSKEVKREISLVADSFKYVADLNKNKIYKNNKIIYFKNSLFEKEFCKQIKYFFSKKIKSLETILQAKKNLLVIHACIKSNNSKKIVKIRNI